VILYSPRRRVSLLLTRCARQQNRKSVLLEDLLRRRTLHEIKCNEATVRVTKIRDEARALLRAGRKEEAKRKLVESKKAEGLLVRTRHIVDLCTNAVVTLEEDTTTFATISVLTEVQRYHRPNTQVVDDLDNALENLRNMHQSAEDVQGVISSGVGAFVDEDDLERELDALLAEDINDEPFPSVPRAPVFGNASGMPMLEPAWSAPPAQGGEMVGPSGPSTIM
jgi:hypothetical protein